MIADMDCEIQAEPRESGKARPLRPRGQLAGGVGQNETCRRETTDCAACERPHPCDRTRVLVVDDEIEVARLFQRGIRQAIPALTVDLAENGRDALEAFRLARHGVLVMDLCLPVMDGACAFRKIRDLCARKGWEMPAVLFCTVCAPPGFLRETLRNPANGLLLKPITAGEVAQAVKSRLNMHRR
jgi:two-component system, sensor histidine kinase and response regulator